MLMLRKTHREVLAAHAETTALLHGRVLELQQALQRSEAREAEVRHDLRVATGLEPRVVKVPVESAAAGATAPPPPPPAWARGVNTPRDFHAAAELHLTQEFAQKEMSQLAAALRGTEKS